MSKVCRIFGINRSSLYYKSKTSNSFSKNEISLVKKAFKDSLNTYGRRRIRIKLAKQGYWISEHRISRIMKLNNLICKHGRKKLAKNIYTFRKINNGHYDNMISGINPKELNNKIYATDISQFNCLDGVLYVSGIIDIHSRYIVNCSTYEEIPKSKSLCEDYKRAFAEYGMPHILHSDRGTQYMSFKMKDFLDTCPTKHSFSAPHHPNNNQYIESFWHTLKTEIGTSNNRTKEQLKMIINYYIDFYNQERIHSSIDYHTPKEIFIMKQY